MHVLVICSAGLLRPSILEYHQHVAKRSFTMKISEHGAQAAQHHHCNINTIANVHVSDVLKILPSWARLAQDREAWRTKIHDLIGHTQP